MSLKNNKNHNNKNCNEDKRCYYYRYYCNYNIMNTNLKLLFYHKRLLLMMMLLLGVTQINGISTPKYEFRNILNSDRDISRNNISKHNNNSVNSQFNKIFNISSDNISNVKNTNERQIKSLNHKIANISEQSINSLYNDKSSQLQILTDDENSNHNVNSIISLLNVYNSDKSSNLLWQQDKKLKNKLSLLHLKNNSSSNYLQSHHNNRIKKIIDNNQSITSSINKMLSNINLRTNIFKHNQKNESNIIDKEITRVEKVLLKYFENLLIRQLYTFFSEIETNSKNDNHLIVNKTSISSGFVSKSFVEDNKNNKTENFVSRALQTGRLLFLKGIKKILWPVFIGIQIAKTVLLALFLPSILGSLGKMVGKGISSVSGFHHPSETVSDLDFKDNGYEFDQVANKYNEYMYPQPQPEASTNHFQTQIYDAATINNNALSRFGFGDQKLMYINTPSTATDQIYSKNYVKPTANQLISNNNGNNFKIFHDIPASSLLLTNYDPFYSPLLSRLDAVFQQLGLGNGGNEQCREKLVCLMYANPAKYAPYSNLVSAQLSRELNELRKPTVDNPDILRFFKYMKSAKNGQDGVNCEQVYESCTSFKDSENPAMLTTYHEINKLVQARKFKFK